ncbi:two component signal transduction system response regulator with FHA domain [Thermosynechococcus sp. NK55a]|jgi:CheY-like chemotaxis protein|uniref:FHA domain-containing protein n=1 Tax=unclassified Thermosynechococcus TaxID=2622553 RepID=UPI0003D82AD3|nr:MULTISPECIES: FHA domain-containing protein [unclassified Thermosynechococcus]AHB89102.1 two component signal transduction system response regulator with FHA domain [Thermosynechococcus sp. NK55a]HIK22847.1 FHA domain-containing protein [Thermosynechococcus sp. M3746_W2019_013]
MDASANRPDTYVPLHSPTRAGEQQRGFMRPSELILAAPTPRLLLHSVYMQRSIVLDQLPAWQIGRSKDCDIVLPDRWCSRRHIRIERQADHRYCLTDLKSMNGTFVGNNRIQTPYILRHGDRISIGESELEYIDLRDVPGPYPYTHHSGESKGQVTVLMTHSSRTQGEMWRELLNSQSISTIWATSHFELEKIIAHLESLNCNINLLLLDLGMPKTNPYNFCRQYRQRYPQMNVILLSGMRTRVHESECKWAVNQGAMALFGGLPRENMLGELTNITERLQTIAKALGWTYFNPEALTSTLLKLQDAVDTEMPGIVLENRCMDE